MKENAIVLTAGVLAESNAKTAHGLIRKTSRYNIIGVIDQRCAGQDAGSLLDGIDRGIPVYADLQDFLDSGSATARFAIVGVAFPGGRLPPEMLESIAAAIRAGMSIVSGAHDFLADHATLRELAAVNGVSLIDIRKPRPKAELKFWSGQILTVEAPIIAVMGTDCALGKRTTAVMLTDHMREKGIRTEMIYTGQTGWLQGHRYGFVLDSTYNDFISGELEHAIVSCWQEEHPRLIIVEGQSALSNPSGPCGSEFLLSGQCKGVIMQHSPARKYFNGQEHTKIKISLDRELKLVQLYGSEVLAITLNTAHLTTEEALGYKEKYEQQFGIPVALPLQEGMESLSIAVTKYMDSFYSAKTNSLTF